MTKKAFKRALIPSVVALVLCFTMLLGATYAWFTDTAASEGNIISSGNLGIDLLVKRPGDTDYVSLKGKTDTAIFNYTLWEPGYTDLVYAQVKNTGNLALKYTMRIIPTGTVSKLAEVIDVYYKPAEVTISGRDLSGLVKIGTLKDVLDGASGVLLDDSLLAGEDDKATLALHMQETAGNEYQNLSIGDGFTIQIIATQFTDESDAIDDQYDASATFPEAEEEDNLPDIGLVVTELDPDTITGLTYDDETLTLDAAVVFSVADYVEATPYSDYANYKVDFVLTFAENDNVKAGDLYLEGQYEAFANGNWVSFKASDIIGDENVVLNQPIQIMDTLKDIYGTVTYQTVVEEIKQFKCGIHVESDATATLQLILTSPDGSETYVLYSQTFSN